MYIGRPYFIGKNGCCAPGIAANFTIRFRKKLESRPSVTMKTLFTHGRARSSLITPTSAKTSSVKSQESNEVKKIFNWKFDSFDPKNQFSQNICNFLSWLFYIIMTKEWPISSWTSWTWTDIVQKLFTRKQKCSNFVQNLSFRGQ